MKAIGPDQALDRLKEGNRSYLDGRTIEADTGGKIRSRLREAQSPIAAIISCSDSRVAPEILFCQGMGALFIIRNAGNTVDTAAMGSLEYAIAALHVPLVVVLGHQRCGAVGAAVKVVEKGAAFPGSIGRMLEPIIPAVLDARRGGASELVDASARANVSRTVGQLREASHPFVLGRINSGKLRVVGAWYDLDAGSVDFFDEGQA